MNSPALLRFVWLAGGLALVLGAGRDLALGLLPQPRELPRADGASGRPWITGEFRPVASLQAIARGALPENIQQVTSWLGSDETQGRAETAWFRASRAEVHVSVGGYLHQPGIKLWAEFRSTEGAVTRVDCLLPDPREEWATWRIPRPSQATSVRLVAEDRSSATFGWVAFSHPYRATPAWVTTLYLHAQVYATVALALTLIWGPGLFWLQNRTPRELSGFVVLATGPLLLAAAGVIIWCAGGWVSPGILGFTLVSVFWLALGVTAARRGFELPCSVPTQRALAVAALVAVAVTAKSTYSVGPEGETFRGTISRNLAAGDRLDSRFPYYIVQAAAQHRSPTAPAIEKQFYPWTFFSRGPLAGLAATPLSLATGGRPSAGFPDQRWSPFDREGFAAYRITLIVLASGIVIACFLLLAPLIGEPWALIACGLVALSPFGVHEIMFTWPKWIATAWLVTSFGLGHARRPLVAGLALGIGFLYHPLVLLWTPWLALWAAGRAANNDRNPRGSAFIKVSTFAIRRRFAMARQEAPADRSADAEGTPPPSALTSAVLSCQSNVTPIATALARLALGAGLLVLPWIILGQVMPHLPDTPFAGQGGFLNYWRLADSNLGTWTQWWHARWLNFANTFLPLHLVVSDASFHHFRLNSTYETSGPLVKFAFVWWNTLPFALGLGLWGLSLIGLAHACRKFRAATALCVIGPAALTVLYWGMDPLGLMRECGHPLFVAIIALLCAVAAREGGWLRRVLLHPAVPWLQLPETWLMLWLTTLLNPRPWAAHCGDLDPLCLAINVLALGAAAGVLARTRGNSRDYPEPANVDPIPTPSPLPALLERLRPFALRPPTWLVLAVGAVVIALRRPDQIRHPQLWAEDGYLFVQAHEMGLRAVFHQLSDYLQLAPRLIAALAQLPDPAWVPHVFVGATMGLTIYVMSRALSRRCPLPWRAGAALSVVLVPDAAEVVLNANNIQWILVGGGVLLLIADDPVRLTQWWHDLIAAVIFGLTGPFSILLTPFFITRAWLRRTRASIMLAGIVAACGVAQAVTIVLSSQPLPAPATLDVAALTAFPGLRVMAVLVFGNWAPPHLPWPLAVGLTVLLGALVAFLSLRWGEARQVRLALGLAFAAMLASTLYRTWHALPLMCELGSASRYVFPLQLILLWLLLAMTRDRTGSVRALCAGAALWMIVTNAPRMPIAPVPDKRWDDYVPRLRAGEAVTIPINPEGWTITVPARKR